MSCGHDQIVHLSGAQQERKDKMKRIQQGVCQQCFQGNTQKVLPKTEYVKETEPIILTVGYLPLIDTETGELLSFLVFNGNVEKYETILKDFGFENGYAWRRKIRESKKENFLSQIKKEIPCEIYVSPDSEQKKKIAEEKLKRWVKPPSLIKGKKWNGKFYGNLIYVDGKQIKITEQQKQELETYQKSLNNA